MKHRLAVSVILVAVAGLPAAPVLADLDYSEAERLRADGTVLPTEKVAGIVADLELERVLGRYVYEVEVRDPDGQEWNLAIDARSGEILQTERDD